MFVSEIGHLDLEFHDKIKKIHFSIKENGEIYFNHVNKSIIPIDIGIFLNNKKPINRINMLEIIEQIIKIDEQYILTFDVISMNDVSFNSCAMVIALHSKAEYRHKSSQSILLTFIWC